MRRAGDDVFRQLAASYQLDAGLEYLGWRRQEERIVYDIPGDDVPHKQAHEAAGRSTSVGRGQDPPEGRLGESSLDPDCLLAHISLSSARSPNVDVLLLRVT